MKVSYLMTMSEIYTIGEILKLSFDFNWIKISNQVNLQPLINKGFIKYQNESMKVNPSIEYIMNSLANSVCLVDDRDLKIFSAEKIVILMQIDKEQINLQTYEKKK